MPLDEAFAWGRVEIPYVTPWTEHIFTFHCREMNEFGDWATPTISEANVAETCTALTQAVKAMFATGTTFGAFTVYKNNPSPTPTEFWLTGEFEPAEDAPSSTSIAARSVTLTARTTKNRKVKFVFLDVDIGIAVPWTRKPAEFGAGLNAAMNYLTGNPNIVTIDGQDFSVPFAATGAVNKTLSRRYGAKANG